MTMNRRTWRDRLLMDLNAIFYIEDKNANRRFNGDAEGNDGGRNETNCGGPAFGRA